MKHPLVTLDRVDVNLGGRPILRDISWSLWPGQHWIVLGRNGSGKSTFLRLVRGELGPAPGGVGQRQYQIDSQPQVTAVGIKESFTLVSPELQNRYLSQEWSLTAGQVIQSGVGGGDYVYQALTPPQRAWVARVTGWMRIAHLVRRNVQELSTGELRRVLIARALAGRPRVLVCDEIGDGLDAASRAVLLEALDDAACAGTQLLLSTHRADEIPRAISHRLVLESGRVAGQGPIGRGHGPEAFLHCFALTPAVARPTQPDKPRMENRSSSPSTAIPNGSPLIQIRGASVYLGSKPTLSGIDLEIHHGQHWAILGPNGSGKSTLLKLIAGDVHAAWGGRVQRFAFTRRNTLWELRARLGFVSPELQAAYREPITAADVVVSGFFSSVGLLRRRPNATQRRQAGRVLKELGLAKLARTNFLELSYGEARRVLLARALVKRPALLLCDEPFDGLDVPSRILMSRALAQVAEAGATLIVVTHHADDLPGCITHVVRMAGGRMASCGSVAGGSAKSGA